MVSTVARNGLVAGNAGPTRPRGQRTGRRPCRWQPRAGHAGWLGTQLEVSRRLRTDPEFAKRWAQRSDAIAEATRERLRRQREAGVLRDDVPLDVLAQFWSWRTTAWCCTWPWAAPATTWVRCSTWSKRPSGGPATATEGRPVTRKLAESPMARCSTRPSYASSRNWASTSRGTSSRSTPASRCRRSPFPGRLGDRVRALRPALGELGVGAQPAGHLQLGAQPAGGVQRRGCPPAGAAAGPLAAWSSRSRITCTRPLRATVETIGHRVVLGDRQEQRILVAEVVEDGTAGQPVASSRRRTVAPSYPCRAKQARARRGSRVAARLAGPGSLWAQVRWCQVIEPGAIRTYGLVDGLREARG